MSRLLAVLAASALLGAAPATPSSSPAASAEPSPSPSVTAPPQPATFQDARAHWPIQGADDTTQRLVDRGVMMLYAFDIGEARVAFGQALKHDPDAALAYWGEAEADTIDINGPQTAEGDKRGAEAVTAGRRHLAHASQTERMLVDAIRKRYDAGTNAVRFARYADALSSWTKTHRDDPNVLTVTAFAAWNAADNLLDGHGLPTPQAKEMLADLDDALKLEPTNLGAHHLRIHLLERLNRAHDGIPDAEALDSYGYPPGTSHLPHMSAHIWTRVGEYARLIDSNERACANDQAWFATGNGPGQEYMRTYHDHDVDFVLYGLTTVGRNDEARAFAQKEDARMQLKVALRLHDVARIGELSKAADSGASAKFAALAAAAWRDDLPAARAAKAKLGDVRNDATLAAMADAMVAIAAHDDAARAAAYARAYAATKNGRPGDPKNSWDVPIGEGYGAALLAAHRFADAETVFSSELKRFPDDPHLEWGLAEALKAQGKDDTAVRSAYKAHWRGASDITLAALG